MTTTAIVIAVIALLVSVIVAGQVAALRRRLAKVPSDGDVVSLLQGIDRDLVELGHSIDDLTPRLESVEQELPHAITRSSIVVYDAFGDITGNLSRSIALLDQRGSGIVISVLVGRAETLFFIKQVRGGRGTEALSPEEEEAVARAMRG